MQTNDLCLIELLEIELLDHWIVHKQMTDVSDTWQYLELYNFVDLCLQIIYI